MQNKLKVNDTKYGYYLHLLSIYNAVIVHFRHHLQSNINHIKI